MSVLRLGHVKLLVMDIDAAVDHYTNVLGLLEQERDDGGSVYLKGWDEWDKYSVILTPSDRAGLEHMAFKVSGEDALTEYEKKIEASGHRTSTVKPEILPYCGRALRFNLPSGHETFLYAEKDYVGKSVGNENPDPWPDGLKGAGVHWLDHVMIMCEVNPETGVNKVEENVTFFRDVLDFGLSEKVVGGPDGDMIAAAWMFCTTTPHDIAFGGAPSAGLHHISFFLDDWSDVMKCADILSKNKVKVDVTPQRHGITRGPTTYFFDPSGNRNETFAGLGYLTQKDMPTIVWTEDNLWRGIFYHTGDAIGDFLGVYT